MSAMLGIKIADPVITTYLPISAVKFPIFGTGKPPIYNTLYYANDGVCKMSLG